MEGGETVTSLDLVEMGGDVMALGVCRDARIRAWSCTRLECIMAHDSLENTAEAGKKLQKLVVLKKGGNTFRRIWDSWGKNLLPIGGQTSSQR